MPSLNRVFLMGHMARDAEIRTLTSGSQVCSFAIGVNHNYTQNGEKKKETSFIDITAYGYLASNMSGIRKGQAVFVSGRMKQDSWLDKETQKKRYRVHVVADQITILTADSDAPKSIEHPDAEPPLFGIGENETPF